MKKNFNVRLLLTIIVLEVLLPILFYNLTSEIVTFIVYIIIPVPFYSFLFEIKKMDNFKLSYTLLYLLLFRLYTIIFLWPSSWYSEYIFTLNDIFDVFVCSYMYLLYLLIYWNKIKFKDSIKKSLNYNAVISILFMLIVQSISMFFDEKDMNYPYYLTILGSTVLFRCIHIFYFVLLIRNLFLSKE